MMSLVGFEYVEFVGRKLNVSKKVEIKQGVKVLDVSKANANVQESDILRVAFDYLCSYEPKVGFLNIRGNMFILVDKKSGDKILENWKDKKSLPKDVLEFVINVVLQRCTIDAINFAQKLNLPSPVPLPKVKVNVQDKNEAKKSDNSGKKKDSKEKKK